MFNFCITSALFAAIVRERVYKLGVDVAVIPGEPEEAMDTS